LRSTWIEVQQGLRPAAAVRFGQDLGVVPFDDDPVIDVMEAGDSPVDRPRPIRACGPCARSVSRTIRRFCRRTSSLSAFSRMLPLIVRLLTDVAPHYFCLAYFLC
jgi:hypothetical protein